MTIDSIIAKIVADERTILLPDTHASIKTIEDEVFYVEPKYEEIYVDQDAKFILFSAPGASGKTALAKHISYKKQCIYWDLSKIKLGENSFHGTLWRAIGQDKLSEYFEQINSGKTGLVLDAFDEAEMISGRSGIDFFLNDLDEVTKNSKIASICLFARTESAIYIAEYCREHHIKYKQYEIGFFEEYNAKNFIKRKILSEGIKVTEVIDKCIDEQFSRIKQLLGNEELSKSFIGYAPVLEALAKTFDNEKNTIKLLENLKGKTVTGTKIIFSIMQYLLNREHEKVRDALKEKWKNKFSDCSNWESIYSSEEQMVRLVEYILLGDVEADSYYDNEMPADLYVDYMEVIKNFLPQHPFLQNIMNQLDKDFTGPAFRDFTLAYVLSIEEYEDLALQYFRDYTQSLHFPSQLLFDFYVVFSEKEIRGNIFPLIYDSYKAKETAAKVAKIEVCDDGENIFSVFNLGGTDSVELRLKGRKRLYISRLSNSDIDISGEVWICDSNGIPRINNSTIICNQLAFQCNDLSIEARTPGAVLIVSRNEVFNVNHEMVDIKVISDRNDIVKISLPNINSYYKLRPYKYDYTETDVKDFIGFYIFVRKVLSLLRKHEKDVPAKDKEYIDNKIINKSDSKRKIMEYLMKKDIIFIDHTQTYLYKLHPEKLATYGLSWATLEDKSTFRKLYEDYVK